MNSAPSGILVHLQCVVRLHRAAGNIASLIEQQEASPLCRQWITSSLGWKARQVCSSSACPPGTKMTELRSLRALRKVRFSTWPCSYGQCRIWW